MPYRVEQRTRWHAKVESFAREVASYLARINATGHLQLQATEVCPIEWSPALGTPLKCGRPWIADMHCNADATRRSEGILRILNSPWNNDTPLIRTPWKWVPRVSALEWETGSTVYWRLNWYNSTSLRQLLKTDRLTRWRRDSSVSDSSSLCGYIYLRIKWNTHYCRSGNFPLKNFCAFYFHCVAKRRKV